MQMPGTPTPTAATGILAPSVSVGVGRSAISISMSRHRFAAFGHALGSPASARFHRRWLGTKLCSRSRPGRGRCAVPPPAELSTCKSTWPTGYPLPPGVGHLFVVWCMMHFTSYRVVFSLLCSRARRTTVNRPEGRCGSWGYHCRRCLTFCLWSRPEND